MATICRLPSGSWRALIRRRSTVASRTFRLRADAEIWARAAERNVDAGLSLEAPRIGRQTTIASLIDLHITDMAEVGQAPRRSKAATLDKLKTSIGRLSLGDLNRDQLIAFAKQRRLEGAGPVTIGMDLSYIRTILVHAAAVHGLTVPSEEVTLARVALRRLGLIGKPRERDRRPTEDELARIIVHHDSNPRQKIPLGRLVRFAVATAMRQDEISRLAWADIDLNRRLAVVRDRKDPRRKDGNHQKVPLIAATGFDPIAILEEQRLACSSTGRVFPYDSRSVGTAFRRACRDLGIEDLHFHDLRHEATSRLFEAGYDIPEVSLVTGHKDWKMLRRYLNLHPDQLVQSKAPRRRYDAP